MGQATSIVLDEKTGTVDLHGRGMDDIPVEKLRRYAAQLRVLNLSENKLTSVPAAMVDFMHIQQLDLSSNRLSSFPEHVLAIPTLERLDVSHNQIREWPPELTSPSLMSILIGSNLVRETPAALSDAVDLGVNVPRLAAIFLQENAIDIATIPECRRDLYHGVEYQKVPQQIVPRLWLGSKFAANAPEELARLGITHVLSIAGARQRSNRAPACATIHFERVFVDDTVEAAGELAGLLEHCVSCLQSWLEDESVGGVLVHCTQGVSRSATVLAAYLMRANNEDSSAALARVQARRYCVNPNDGFREVLLTFPQS